MSETGRRLAGFTLVVAGAFGMSYAVGERLPGHDHSSHSHAVNTSAYQLSPEPDGAFTLRATNGMALTSFAVNHQALLHVILVRPDLSEMVHLHPTPAPDGAFTVDTPDAGPWRIFAEALPAGQSAAVVGATDVGSTRPFTATALPAESPTTTITAPNGDTITVRRDGMDFTVTAPLRTQPFLGMPAHLIAIRAADMAFAHLHPVTTGPDRFFFDATGMDDGVYRAFLQFTYDGHVVTVPFTVHRVSQA